VTPGGRIPVTIVGGFLGSGKTSLLRQMLSGASDTAVIVNEFGAVGLDHQLLRACEERVELVGGGCACCSRREDLVQTLRELLDARDRGRAQLSRAVIECSGLADPAPIVFTITHDPMLRHHFDVERLIVTVDALNGPGQLDAHAEATKQVLLADEVVVTKPDLVDEETLEQVASALARLNPSASIRSALHGVVSRRELRAGCGGDGHAAAGAAALAPGMATHTDDVRSLWIPADGPVDWLGFSVWLSMLLHARGEQVLRVKGLLALDEGSTLVSVNGVQHVVHMPEHVPRAAVADAAAGIVFITRGLDVALVRESFEAFQRLGRVRVRVGAGVSDR
jgi:G3E family GTPase